MLDFYYQTGEFVAASGDTWDFVKDLTVEIAGTVIGGALALWLYIKQIRDERIRGENDRLERDINNLKFFHFLFKDSINSIESLSESFYQLNDDLKRPFAQVPNLILRKPYDNIKRIAETIDQKEIYLSYSNVVREFRITQRENVISDIYSIIDVVNGNILRLNKDYTEHMQLIVSAYNQLIDKISSQNSAIGYLRLEQYDKELTDQLWQIRDRYNIIAKQSPEHWFREGVRRQMDIFNLFGRVDFQKHKDKLKPINDLNIEISQILISIEAYKGTLINWSNESAQDMYRYMAKLKVHFHDLDKFIVNIA
jgi:hypothetical protein